MKKNIIILGILAISAFVLNGCTSSYGFSINEEKNESKFYMTEKESENLYTINNKSEKNKLLDNKGQIKYIDSLDIYLTIDEKGELYSINSNLEKEKIAEGLESINDVFVDKKIIYYKDEENNLYMIKEGEEPVKLASTVTGAFRVKKDKVIYVDGEGNIYEKSPNEKDKHIASDALYFELSSDWKEIIYSTPNGIFYKNIEFGNEEKIAEDKTGIGIFKFLNKNEIIYLEDYSLETKSGNLIVKKIGEEKKLIAKNVTLFEIIKNNIYYLDVNSSLYIKENNKETIKKINDNVYDIQNNHENIYLSTEDEILYKIDKDKKIEISKNVKEYDVTNQQIVFLTNNGELYVEDKKISDNVKKYFINSQEIAYLTSDDKIYLSKGEKTKIIFDDSKEYKTIKFMENVLFENNFSANDLNGYWESEGKNGKKIFLSFKDNMLEAFTINGQSGEAKVSFSGKTGESMTMQVEHLNINILKFDKDTIILDGDILNKIDRKTYVDATKNINK